MNYGYYYCLMVDKEVLDRMDSKAPKRAAVSWHSNTLFTPKRDI